MKRLHLQRARRFGKGLSSGGPFGKAQPSMPDPRSFRERYCKHYGIADAEFDQAALKHFLHSPWRWWAGFLARSFPTSLVTDLDIVRQLGRIASTNNLSAEVRGIRSEYQRRRDFGITRRFLRRRLSSARIFAAAKECWGA
jgi:hypothetical protein